MILSKRIGRIQKQLEHVNLIDTRNEIFLLTYSDNVYIKIGFCRNNGVASYHKNVPKTEKG